MFIILDGTRYWIRSEEDFNALVKAQPIKDLSWDGVVEVESFDMPCGGKIIGSVNFVDLFKQIFGGIFGNK